jgi:hypothetical protein
VVDNILLYPNCDLHMTMNPASSLALRVVRQTDGPAAQNRYNLTTLRRDECEFDWFRPYNAPGHRLENAPTVVPGDGVTTTAEVSNPTPGIYLFQVRVGTQYLVGRLQVHKQVDSWWFGNESITTARNPIAHAQPSIYARFSDDNDTGVDAIGDITGHGYVALATSDPNAFTVTPDGRLLGLNATTDPAHLPRVSGTWPALGQHDTPGSIPVRVVDYTTAHPILETVRDSGVADFANKQNIVILSEGFAAGDRSVFDRLAQQAADEMFSKPRHEPYALLQGNFNVFKAFTPSVQRTLTCGFPIKTAKSDKFAAGTAIPAEDTFSDPAKYRMIDLFRLVGLPRRNEPGDDDAVRAQWLAQGLPGPDPALDLNLDRVDTAVIKEWREHRSDGILSARDTFFGLYTGVRWGDRFSRTSRDPATGQEQALLPPGADGVSEKATRDFVHRLYEFYANQVPGTVPVQLDPRRHPPELYATSFTTNRDNTVVQFLGSLRYTTPVTGATLAIGGEWVPNDGAFQRSRGLVVMLCLDDHRLGQNINVRSLTALSGGVKPTVDFNQVAGRQLTRTPPANISPDLDEIVNVVAHELGHSFNLDDEYEDVGGPGPALAHPELDISADNITHFAFISAHDPAFPDDIDPARVKWLAVPRTFLSSRLTAPSQMDGPRLRVPIKADELGQWRRAKESPGLLAEVRTVTYSAPPTRQLDADHPLPVLTGLTIADVDPAGAVLLTGPGLPPAAPVPAGSVLQVPLLDKPGGSPLLAIEPVVRQFLVDTHQPLNRDTDTKLPNKKRDQPRLIRGFLPPCKNYKVVGVYEGGEHAAAHFYRPTGGCKMRNPDQDGGDEFCFICKWLIVNRIDPGMHALLTQRFYPNSKSGTHG